MIFQPMYIVGASNPSPTHDFVFGSSSSDPKTQNRLLRTVGTQQCCRAIELFLLADPKGKYPHISNENWALIQQGKVGTGMTKEECKLSIGNPDDLQSGHSRSQTMDIWQYNDGTFLMFEDGLLTRFRQ